MLHVNVTEVPFEELRKEGAEAVRVKYLIDERAGANRFYLRYYELSPAGKTPLDRHSYEHEVYVLSGTGKLRLGQQDEENVRALKPGDAVFIASNEVHRFENDSKEPFVFLCVKGDPRLYELDLKEAAEEGAVC